ncbi:MAG: YkvA family protein [Gemmatimonas sp.]
MTEDSSRESILTRRAREREEDRANGRPQRGLFTGRGPKPARPGVEPIDEELDDVEALSRDEGDELGDDELQEDYVSAPERPRVGARRNLLAAIRQIPAYLRLMLGLMSDGRVSRVDRLLVVAAAAYMISPLDLLPDIIPFFGQADDVFLVVLAMQRLIDNAGRRVLLDHWKGDPDDLSESQLTTIASAAGFFLPVGIRKRLGRMATKRITRRR